MLVDRSSSKYWGFFTRTERWGLSWRGRMTLFVTIVVAGWVVLVYIQPFLVVTRRVPTRVLVVEGWVHGYGIEAAVKEFKTGQYSQVYATGGPVEGIGPTSSIYDTEAHRTAGLLKQAGIPAENVQSVPACYVGRDRTYTSAVVLRDWFREHNVQADGINVLTEDAHGRRTWLLFQEAMGPGIKVGIISAADPDYDARHWWYSSAGVREVLDEAIAYIYAKFFFWPASAEQSAKGSPGRISYETHYFLAGRRT
jgi:hypothetical protein